MNQQPEKVPLLFSRDKILAENKKLLKEQQNAVEPKLQIKIKCSNIPDYSMAFMKGIQEHKEKLTRLTETETKNLKSVAVEKLTEMVQNQQAIRRMF